MLQALARLDNWSAPPPEMYDLLSGQPIEDYHMVFENYCENTFKESSSLWIPKLGRLLRESIQAVYRLG